MHRSLRELPLAITDRLRAYENSEARATDIVDETMLHSARGERDELLRLVEKRTRARLGNFVAMEKGEIERRDTPMGLEFSITLHVFTPVELAKLLRAVFDDGHSFGAGVRRR